MMMDDLEHLLQKRAAPMDVPDALMARILDDAMREQPRFAWPAPATAPMGIWAVLSDLFGGGGVLAGLATAACAGLSNT
ncbi:MAG: hypothetical protein U5N55_14010 [Cypionkella sp.]|nr:hypothetical protein [Cypionkella sp.]